MGAPNSKAACMGRAPMIPGMVGKGIGEWIAADKLPKTAGKSGAEVAKLPLGAVGRWSRGAT